MLRKERRRIHSKSARAMATWNHYRFQQRLLHKTREFPWCRVIICDEHYTSKTCGNCKFIHDKLAGSKTFQCPQCQFTLDRGHQRRKKHSDSLSDSSASDFRVALSSCLLPYWDARLIHRLIRFSYLC
jgi:predicted RNA-binding Zn-ribbon protein involved in translation (DUF1610 family)